MVLSLTTLVKTKKEVAKKTDRDFFMSAEEALKFGVIDEIFTPGE